MSLKTYYLSFKGTKHCGGKKEKLVTSIFFFSLYVFKSPFSNVYQISRLFETDLITLGNKDF